MGQDSAALFLWKCLGNALPRKFQNQLIEFPEKSHQNFNHDYVESIDQLEETTFFFLQYSVFLFKKTVLISVYFSFLIYTAFYFYFFLNIYLFGCIRSYLQSMGLLALWYVASQFPDLRLNLHPLYCKADS